jgi:hypothetical protein
MLYFHIQHHGVTPQLIWLLKKLQHKDAILKVSYDGSNSQKTRIIDEIDRLDLRVKDIQIGGSQPIYWCGPSQARQTIYSMREALARNDWKYYINLSGVCAPLRALDILIEYLDWQYENGIEAHVFSYLLRKPFVWPPKSTSEEMVTEVVGRLHLNGSRSMIEFFKDHSTFPVLRVANRPFVNCLEIPGDDRILSVARPHEDELKFRERYFNQYGHYCGRAWYIFSRQVVEAIIDFYDAQSSLDWREVFFGTFQPDETFIQTALEGHSIIPPDKISRKSLRAFEGSPRHISDKDFSDVIGASGAFFVRKVDHANAKKLKDWIDLIV